MTPKRPTLSDLLRESHVAPALVDRLALPLFMGARFPSAFTTNALTNVPASGAETVILTTSPLTLPFDGTIVFLVWYCSQTIGTGTTAGTVRIRRGTAASAPAVTPVAVPLTVVAGNLFAFSGVNVDVIPGPTQPQYSLTLTGTGTTGAWTNQDQALLAFAL